MNNSGWNMYVFRDGRRTETGLELVESLIRALCLCEGASGKTCSDTVLQALIAAGELECALWDNTGSRASSSLECIQACEITESLAHAFLTGCIDSHLSILEKAKAIRNSSECVSATYVLSVQEGFAYYALHPRKIALLLDSLALGARTAVLGIRSIGVTLSAVACESLRLRGLDSKRITVRPTGHPYDRKLESTRELCAWIDGERDAEFLIVDEGPGISGSSFLSVAEALADHGIANQRIHMIGSREVDPTTLRADNAGERWQRYTYHILHGAPLVPEEAGVNVSGGVWRESFCIEKSAMPATWTSLEPAKFLARDKRTIFKFEGYGRYGEGVGERSKVLADERFAPRYFGSCCGFGRYQFVPGRSLELRDLSPELLERMAEYLAFRASAFSTNTPQTPELEKMLCRNWKLEFGEELSEDESQLLSKLVVICDGRMMPHEWLKSDGGELLKLDASLHGDNHFFPGPCDIAWDVAGTIVEWELSGVARRQFISEYESRTGDSIQQRLEPFLLAYSVFRLGWSKMAAAAMQGQPDEALLLRDYQRYRMIAAKLRSNTTCKA